jgi:leucyl aminopeptidase
MATLEVMGIAPAEARADLLALPVFEEEVRALRSGPMAELDRRLGGHLAAAARAEAFSGKADSSLALHTLGRLPAGRLLLVGLGPRKGPGPLEALRMAAGGAARAAGRAGARRLALVLPEQLDPGASARAAGEGALLGAYRFDRYLSRKKGDGRLEKVLLLAPRGREKADGVREEARLAALAASAVAWARDLVNEPPMVCTPTFLAAAAQALAREAGLRAEVRGPKEIAALRMGMFLGVTRGSSEEPRLVKVSWIPRGAGGKRRPLVLVGKAITFDSGGLSLKPTDGMVTMNGDMAGAAAVVGAMKVVAELAPPFPVHAVFGACENMPGGRAYKPSDVLRAYNGKTVQVTNTDAEGRLVLGDVLAWAADTLRPAAMVDVATLTGACVVALGNFTVGAMGPDGPVIEAVLAAARSSGEDFWRLPLTEALRENLKSDVADMKNTGERWGGALAAGLFLREFVGDVPWAHLDIAGPSHASKERGYWTKGGTGVPLRTLVELVRAWKA